MLAYSHSVTANSFSSQHSPRRNNIILWLAVSHHDLNLNVKRDFQLAILNFIPLTKQKWRTNALSGISETFCQMVEKTALEQRGSTSFWSPEPVLIFAETASYKVKQPRCTRFVADLRLKIEAVYERHFKSYHMEATPLKTAKWTRSNRAVSLSWNVLISIRWKTRQNPTPICTAKGVLGELDIGRKQNGR